MSLSEREQKVENLIDDLGLRKVVNTRIGGEMMRGVSGGEKKRVAIGVQLIRDPSVLFLDGNFIYLFSLFSFFILLSFFILIVYFQNLQVAWTLITVSV